MPKSVTVFLSVVATLLLTMAILMLTMLTACSFSMVQNNSKGAIEEQQTDETNTSLTASFPIACDECDKEIYAIEEEQQQESSLC